MTNTLAAYQAAVMADFGYKEGPNNSTKFGQWYADRVRNQAFATAAWCDMATSYWGNKVGAEDIVGFFAWTPSHAQWFINRGQWSRTPVRGGIAFWDWSGQKSVPGIDHVSALIESVDPNGQAVTIDANYADRVDRWRHPMSNFVGCGLPRWSAPVQSEEDDMAFTKEELVSIINSTVIDVFRSPEAKQIMFDNTLGLKRPWVDPITGQVPDDGGKSASLVIAWLERRVHGEAQEAVRPVLAQLAGLQAAFTAFANADTDLDVTQVTEAAKVGAKQALDEVIDSASVELNVDNTPG